MGYDPENLQCPSLHLNTRIQFTPTSTRTWNISEAHFFFLFFFTYTYLLKLFNSLWGLRSPTHFSPHHLTNPIPSFAFSVQIAYEQWKQVVVVLAQQHWIELWIDEMVYHQNPRHYGPVVQRGVESIHSVVSQDLSDCQEITVSLSLIKAYMA